MIFDFECQDCELKFSSKEHKCPLCNNEFSVRRIFSTFETKVVDTKKQNGPVGSVVQKSIEEMKYELEQQKKDLRKEL